MKFLLVTFLVGVVASGYYQFKRKKVNSSAQIPQPSQSPVAPGEREL